MQVFCGYFFGIKIENKILIIGQAPPAVKQEFPYDTTLLYEMLGWVGISKEQAQDMFEFEAMTDKFPGHGPNGHLKPTLKEMQHHLDTTLNRKIINSDKMIVLGNVAKEALLTLTPYGMRKTDPVLFLIHPSKRNYSKIMAQKEQITEQLTNLLKQ